MRYFLIMLAVCLAACSAEEASTVETAKVGDIPAGPWRVVLEHPGGGLPFTLEIEEGPAAYFLNGPERMEAEQITVDGGTLDIRFPSYDSTFTGTLQPDGTLKGTAVLTRRLGELKQIEFDFVATHGQTWRHFAEQDPNPANVGGTWAMQLSNPFGGPPREGLALLEQDGAFVTGTMLLSVGDYRWLQGEVKDGELYLSSYDGGQGTVWRATVQQDGSLEGLLHAKSYGFPPVPWSAVRDPDAKLPDANSFTKMVEGAGPLAFSLPNLDGETISLSDDKFQGKVVLVTIGGTWCPTCHDEAAFVAPYYKANKDRGLEVVGLQFEYTDDFERNKRQIGAFKKRYGITYDMLIAGAFGADNVKRVLPMIDQLTAYPTTLFVDRRGTVRRIHTSFPGAATGKRHDLYIAEFTEFLDLLLEEKAG